MSDGRINVEIQVFCCSGRNSCCVNTSKADVGQPALISLPETWVIKVWRHQKTSSNPRVWTQESNRQQKLPERRTKKPKTWAGLRWDAHTVSSESRLSPLTTHFPERLQGNVRKHLSSPKCQCYQDKCERENGDDSDRFISCGCRLTVTQFKAIDSVTLHQAMKFLLITARKQMSAAVFNVSDSRWACSRGAIQTFSSCQSVSGRECLNVRQMTAAIIANGGRVCDEATRES